MSDLIYLVPDKLAIIESNRSESTILNLNSINKSKYYKEASDYPNISFTYTVLSGENINYLYLGKIGISVRRATETLMLVGAHLQYVSLSVMVEADDNSSFTTPEIELGYIGVTDLMGLELDDYILPLSFTTSYNYYRVTIATVASPDISFEFSKLILNETFDLGCFSSISFGNTFIKGDRNRKRTFTIRYEGIESSLREELYEKLLRYKTVSPVALIDNSATSNILPNNEKVIFCKVSDSRITSRIEGSFDVELILESIY